MKFSFTPGTRYAAGVDAPFYAPNSMVASKFASVGFPDAEVTDADDSPLARLPGARGEFNRVATGTFKGSRVTVVELPEQVAWVVPLSTGPRSVQRQTPSGPTSRSPSGNSVVTPPRLTPGSGSGRVLLGLGLVASGVLLMTAK